MADWHSQIIQTLEHPFLVHHSRRLELYIQCDDGDGIVTRKQHTVLVQRMELPWDPGGLSVVLATWHGDKPNFKKGGMLGPYSYATYIGT
jgi:hypothetical protein